MISSAPIRSPRWYAIPIRVLLVTFIGTLLCFAIALLLAIFGTVALAAFHGVHPDMRIAYRMIAAPFALSAGAIMLLLMSILEIRRYRQMKTLSAIERLS
jgi:hypothetical protein